MRILDEISGNRDQNKEELDESPHNIKKECMLLVLINMRRLGSRHEREMINEIMDFIENNY